VSRQFPIFFQRLKLSINFILLVAAYFELLYILDEIINILKQEKLI